MSAFFDFFGFTADANILIPFVNMELDAGGVNTNTSGMGDPGLVATIWFIDDKLSKRYLALAEYVFIPIGDYQNDGSLTAGSNRWQGKTSINFTQGFEVIPNHDMYLELGFGLDYYSENDDYGPESQTMSQDPVYTLDAHISYDITKNMWISADYCGVWGGAQSFGGNHNQGEQNTQTVGGSFSYMITPNTNILLQYSKDIYVENGIKSDNLLMRFMYAFNANALWE